MPSHHLVELFRDRGNEEMQARGDWLRLGKCRCGRPGIDPVFVLGAVESGPHDLHVFHRIGTDVEPHRVEPVPSGVTGREMASREGRDRTARDRGDVTNHHQSRCHPADNLPGAAQCRSPQAYSHIMWLYVLTTVAYLLQIVGALLVVLDVLKSHRLARQLDQAFSGLDGSYQSQMEGVDERALEEAGGDENIAQMVKPLLATSLQARYIEFVTVLLRTYLGESWPKRRWTWFLGPVALILGLALGLWASLLAL